MLGLSGAHRATSSDGAAAAAADDDRRRAPDGGGDRGHGGDREGGGGSRQVRGVRRVKPARRTSVLGWSSRARVRRSPWARTQRRAAVVRRRGRQRSRRIGRRSPATKGRGRSSPGRTPGLLSRRRRRIGARAAGSRAAGEAGRRQARAARRVTRWQSPANRRRRSRAGGGPPRRARGTAGRGAVRVDLPLPHHVRERHGGDGGAGGVRRVARRLRPAGAGAAEGRAAGRAALLRGAERAPPRVRVSCRDTQNGGRAAAIADGRGLRQRRRRRRWRSATVPVGGSHRHARVGVPQRPSLPGRHGHGSASGLGDGDPEGSVRARPQRQRPLRQPVPAAFRRSPAAGDAFEDLAAAELGKGTTTEGTALRAKNMAPLDAPPGTLRRRLVDLMTHLDPGVKRGACELLWELSDRESTRFVLRTGFGNAVHFLGIRGCVDMPAGSGARAATPVARSTRDRSSCTSSCTSCTRARSSCT